jgi:hypothetical protein
MPDPAVRPEEVGQPVADTSDFRAVQLELFVVGLRALANVADEDEAFEAKNEVVEVLKA